MYKGILDFSLKIFQIIYENINSKKKLEIEEPTLVFFKTCRNYILIMGKNLYLFDIKQFTPNSIFCQKFDLYFLAELNSIDDCEIKDFFFCLNLLVSNILKKIKNSTTLENYISLLNPEFREKIEDQKEKNDKEWQEKSDNEQKIKEKIENFEDTDMFKKTIEEQKNKDMKNQSRQAKIKKANKIIENSEKKFTKDEIEQANKIIKEEEKYLEIEKLNADFEIVANYVNLRRLIDFSLSIHLKNYKTNKTEKTQKVLEVLYKYSKILFHAQKFCKENMPDFSLIDFKEISFEEAIKHFCKVLQELLQKIAEDLLKNFELEKYYLEIIDYLNYMFENSYSPESSEREKEIFQYIEVLMNLLQDLIKQSESKLFKLEPQDQN
ncbi:MAG: hypothetical protein LBJ32_01145 [Oscillospiraceae bacterium]|jgi:hypothetical protein|nr:hypothetical protein [Oscillospiraceae bacterium]